MGRPSKSSVVVVNLLISLAITLVVNFSYLLLLIVDKKNEPRTANREYIEIQHEGMLHLTADGHGYLLYTEGGIDSVYVPQQRVRRLGLVDGDRLVVGLHEPRNQKAHHVMASIRQRNGEEFDYGQVFNRSSEWIQTLYQLLYFSILAFILLSVITSGRHHTIRRFIVRCIWCAAAALLFCLLTPTLDWHTGRMQANILGGGRLDFILMLKWSFTLVVVVLYGWIYRLGSQRQAMEVENERLKNENLVTRYNMLVNQVNPHFFFNSLNSLAMLVREKHNDKALTYIDQLSYTFRYILQNGQNMLITLDQELKFADAYAYLFKIRYADKLFFDITIDQKYRSWQLPALTLQPLIDNAVKHNAITRANPLHVSLRIEDGVLVVSNPRVPKLEPESGTGIGLENLRNRWQLITGYNIDVTDTGTEFIVRLPLQKPHI